ALLTAILLLWAYSVRIRDVSFIDAFWAFGMVVLAWATWAQSANPGARSNLILALTTLWGMRLTIHLWIRWRAHGEDPRYTKIMASRMSLASQARFSFSGYPTPMAREPAPSMKLR
ncbi:MAG: hypothetical protein B7Z55_17650, partial [Planctomycetales bacterium 12-60-4]